jgi:hypothetical protein
MPRTFLTSETRSGYGVKYNIWEGRYYGGDTYFHFKTNMSGNSWNMAMVEAVGDSYGSNQAIRCAWGWHVSSWCGGLYSVALQNFYGGLDANGIYMSSDCYVVLRANGAPYFSGWCLNAYTLNPTGDFDLQITASVQTSNGGNYY